MSLRVREVDVENERDRLLSVLTSELEDWRDSTRFDWMYLENPFGKARSWVLEDRDEEPVGVASAFPRQVLFAGEPRAVWVLGDFCVARAHRSLGPALQLQRKVNDAMRGTEVDAWYDFPSRTMTAVHQRTGVDRFGDVLRLVLLLRLDSIVGDRFGSAAVGRAARNLGNSVLALRSRLRVRDRTLRIDSVSGALQASKAPRGPLAAGVTLHRTSDYLNWRYRRDPRGPASVLGCDGGFLVFRRTKDAAIVDLYGVEDRRYFRALVLEVVTLAKKGGAERVTATISADHPWVPWFEELGFVPRDSVPYAVLGRPGTEMGDVPWHLVAGDRDF